LAKRLASRKSRLPAVLIKKDDAHSELKYTLLAFFEPNGQNGEFAEGRLRFYQHLDKLFVLPAHRSSIPVTGLKSIFYSRFFSLADLAQSVFGSKEAPNERLMAILSKRPPNHRFKLIIDDLMKERDSLTEADVANQDLYEDAIKRHIGDEADAKFYLALERKLLELLQADSSKPLDGNGLPPGVSIAGQWTVTRLRERFSALNRSTLPYVRRSLEPDYRRLQKTHERVKEFVKQNLVLLTAVATLVTLCLGFVTIYKILKELKKADISLE
jgi:hypothetical protein